MAAAPSETLDGSSRSKIITSFNTQLSELALLLMLFFLYEICVRLVLDYRTLWLLELSAFSASRVYRRSMGIRQASRGLCKIASEDLQYIDRLLTSRWIAMISRVVA